MKKLALVLVVLLAFGGLVFAETAPFTVGLSGDASLTWELDLDGDNLNGFENASSAGADITIELATTRATEGSGWWGELEVSLKAINLGSRTAFATDADGIAVNGVKLYADGAFDDLTWDADDEVWRNDDGDEVTVDPVSFLTGSIDTSVDVARIQNGVLYIDITKPDTSVDMAKNFHGGDDAINTSSGKVEGHGFTFGQFEQDALVKTFAIAVSSDDGKASNSYSYAAIATLDLAEIVDLDAGVYLLSVPQANTFGFGLKPTISVAPATIVLGFDGKLADEFTYDFLADIAVDLGDINVSLKAFNATGDVLDVQAGVTATLIEVLKAGLTVDARELINDADVTLGIAADLTYDGSFGENTFIDEDLYKADAFTAAGLFGAGVKVSTDDVLGEAIDLKVNVGAGTVVDAISANVWSILNISTAEGSELGWSVAGKLGYEAGGLGVFAGSAVNDAMDAMNKVQVVAGSDFTSINNTTFTLTYGVSKYGPNVDNTNGKLTLETKIAF